MQLTKFFGLGLIALAGTSAGCSGWAQYKHESHIDRARNSAWPQPFRSADAAAVVLPFEIMKANGWQEFNTVAQCYFDANHQLTDAGHLKVQQVLQLAPANHRIVYVEKAETPQATASRVEAMELAISSLIPVGDLPQIAVTSQAPNASSGAYQTMVHRALIRTTPTPRLPAFSSLNGPAQTTVAPNANQSPSK